MQRVKIWDSYVRFSHWLIVLLLVAMWWTAENGHMQWHLRLAPALGALVLVRIVWGLLGSESAKFSRFVRGPRAVLEHLQELRQGHYQPEATHNPLGGWAVLLLLGLLLAQFISGLFADDEIFFSGPLASWFGEDFAEVMTEVHEGIFELIVVVAAIHIVAIFAYRLRGINLIPAMLHGYRRLPVAPKIRNGVWGLLLALLIGYGLFIWIN